jgi:Protein of unknown function (DUF2934)
MTAPTIDFSTHGKLRAATTSSGGSIGAATSTHNEAMRFCHPAALGWREAMIHQAAYFRSQRRRPGQGHELEDWLAAEREIDKMLACGAAPYT